MSSASHAVASVGLLSYAGLISLALGPIVLGSGLVSTALAAVIGLEAYRLYRYTGRSYLLHFLFGFILLGLSYYILALFIAPVGMPVVERGLQWPRLVVQAVAYAMLSLAYFARAQGTGGERVALVLLLSVVAVVTPLLVLASPPPSVLLDRSFFLLDFVLAVYVFWRASRGYLKSQDRSTSLVVSGFGLLVLSQYSLFVNSFDGGDASSLLAHLFRIAGLVLLVLALYAVSRD